MTRRPSSGVSAPATTAAVTSPIECPITASGSTPYERHNAVNANCRPISTGWTRASPATRWPSVSTWCSENRMCSRNSGSNSSTAAANTGSSTSSCRPMPAHCEPCPEYTKTVPGLHNPSCGSTSPIADWPTAKACRPATAWARSRTTSVAKALVLGAVVVERVGDIGQRHRGAGADHPVGQRGGRRGDARRSLARDHQRGDHRFRLRRSAFRAARAPARRPRGHWCR